MKNLIQPGRVVSALAPYALTSGQGALVGRLFGIACADAANGAPVELLTEGVVEVAKVSAQAWTQGQAIHWDNTAKLFTTVTTGNWFVGVATEAAANPTATGKVRLNGSMPLAASA